MPTQITRKQRERPPIAITGDLDDLHEFLRENRDRLVDMEGQLLELKEGSSVEGLLRAYHTIKSDASFVQLRDLREVAHEVETLLEFVYRGELQLDSGVIQLLFDALDLLQSLLHSLNDALSVDGLLYPLQEVPDLIDRIRKTIAMRLMQGVATSSPSQTVVRHSTSVRVKWEQLERLAIIADELQEWEADLPSPAQELLSELKALTTDLQMVSADELLQQVRRVTRDTTQAVGKQVDLVTEGGEHLVPRHLAAKLAEWLPHLVRNAIDHGLEFPQERVKAGKQPLGTLKLRFARTQDQLLVDVSDDGRGIDVGGEDIEVVFKPGFTTKQAITHISGRGVGLDAVATGVKELNGSVELATTPGEGTTFTLRLPAL